MHISQAHTYTHTLHINIHTLVCAVYSCSHNARTLSLYECVCVCMCVCHGWLRFAYLYTSVYIYIYIHIATHAHHTPTHLFALNIPDDIMAKFLIGDLDVLTYPCVCVYIHIYTHTHPIYAYIHTHTPTHICIYTYTHCPRSILRSTEW